MCRYVGGLGSLGLIAGSWWSARSPDTHLVLVSRSGRASASTRASLQLQALLRGSSLVTITRCDVSSQAAIVMLQVAACMASDRPIMVCTVCTSYRYCCCLDLYA